MFNPLLSILLLSLASVSSPSLLQEGGRAAVTQVESNFRLDALASPAGPGSSLPHLIHGADGKVYLTWIESEGGNTGTLRLSVLADDGWGEPVDVFYAEDLFLNWADFPSVCVLENGVLLAHWLRRGETPQGYFAEFSLSVDRGHHWTEPKTLHSDLSEVEHGFVSFVPIDSTSFGAIWLDGRKMLGKKHGVGEMALYFRTITATGELGTEMVLDDRVCDCCQTSLVVAPGGDLIATYRDRSVQEVRDISMVRFDGKSWSDPKFVHEDGWLIAGCPVNGPRVAFVKDATAAVWFTGAGAEAGNVFVAFKGALSTSFGFPIVVDEGHPMGRVDVVGLGDSILVSWLEFVGESGSEWRIRRLWEDGRKGDFATIGEVPSSRSSGYLRMAKNGADTILAWTAGDIELRVETAKLRVGSTENEKK
ncbi:MAG: hypothetical protein ACI8X5_001910 [Planctomycetota bacterium]|jgi:hypothetical protein